MRLLARLLAICFSDIGYRAAYCALAVQGVGDLHFGASVDAYQQAARFRYVDGEQIDNVTDWALNRFHDHYEKGKGRRARPITKDAICSYVYAVLHDPVYREVYALNLKREFARIPFYADFWQWADWGQALLKLHIDYEQVARYELAQADLPDEKCRKAGVAPRPILRSDKDSGLIVLDSETTLAGVPPIAWNYLLGNRCAIDWVLDQHKEKTPKHLIIREKFNTYRFADHKEKVIDLLMRVTTVSVETMKIVEAMRVTAREEESVDRSSG